MNGFEANKSCDDVEKARRQVIEQLSELEKEKEDFEVAIIEDANRRTTKVIARYEMTVSPVALDAIHVIPKSKWPEISEGFMSRETGAIVAEQENQDLFLLRVVHEMFHLKGVNFLPIPLTEAIVERLSNEAINSDDVGLEGAEKFSGTYTYDKFRKLLDKLIEKIIESIPVHEIDKTHVFTFFAKAHLSGSVSYLDFLDDIFGPGTLKKLNELSDNPEDLDGFISELKKF